MRVAAERETEMACIGGAIIGLRLAAKDRLHDFGQPVVFGKAIDQTVEHRGGYDLSECEALFEGFEIIFQADELFAARRLVDAVHDRRLLRLERLRGRDVRRDHIILDQPHRIEPLANADFGDAALFVEDDLPFGEVEAERRARVTRLGEQLPASPEIFERGQDVGVPAFVGRIGVIRRLRAFIGNVRVQPDERAGEAPRRHLAMLVDDKMARHRGAVLSRFQRTHARRQRFG